MGQIPVNCQHLTESYRCRVQGQPWALWLPEWIRNIKWVHDRLRIPCIFVKEYTCLVQCPIRLPYPRPAAPKSQMVPKQMVTLSTEEIDKVLGFK